MYIAGIGPAVLELLSFNPESLVMGWGGGGGGGWHHNFVVIAPMIFFGTGIKLDVFYTMVTKNVTIT